MKENVYKILIWNINQRANFNRKGCYPDIVKQYIRYGYDIIILNEFYKHKDWNSTFKLNGYEIVTSNNDSFHNDILIAYDSNKFSTVKNPYTWKSDYSNGYPDYLDIKLRDKFGKYIYVVGTRILVNDYIYEDKESLTKEMKARKKQGEHLIKRLQALSEEGCPIVGGGDMNTGRRANKNEIWSKSVLDKLMPQNMKVVMPNGVSHEAYKDELYAGCPDLLLISRHEIEIVECKPYNWDFAEDKDFIEIYPEGKRTRNIKVPYPDHAMIQAEFFI